MNTVISRDAQIIFQCEYCQTKSRVEIQAPEDGTYKITCYNCETPVKVKIQNGEILSLQEDAIQLTPPFQYQPPQEDRLEKKEIIRFRGNSSYIPDQNQRNGISTQKSIIRDIKTKFKKTTDFGLLKKTTSPNERPFIQSLKIGKSKITDRTTVIGKTRIDEIKKPKHATHDAKKKNWFPYHGIQKKYFYISGTLVAFAIGVIWNVVAVLNYKSEINSLLSELAKNKPSKILDANGKVVSEIFQKRTSSLKINEYPEQLKKIILRIEDNDFYSHFGMDVFSIFRAMAVNAFSFEYKHGASTITQQLARILINKRKKSIFRKIKEAQIAFALEMTLSKNEILEAYMNQVYLGHGAFGFGDAAKFYFDKEVKGLSPFEMTLLASLASAPAKYSPLKNPEASKIRFRALVSLLSKKGILSSFNDSEIGMTYLGLKKKPSDTVFSTRLDRAPYVTEHIREILKSVDPSINIYEEGGYTVETTLNVDIQDALDDIVRSHLASLITTGAVKKTKILNGEKVRESADNSSSGDLQAAVIGVNPHTGEILFFHGGNEFSSGNQFNRAIQMKRQTGSTIKPILYASAIDSGVIHAGTRVLDAPILFRGMRGQKNWAPDNIGMTYDGEISVREALVRSKNTAAVQVAEKLGAEKIEKYFSIFFFPDKKEKEKRFRNDLSVSLGTLDISPLEMAVAFGSFSNDGKIIRPVLIKRILDKSGKTIYSSENKDEFHLKIPSERIAISPDASEVMVSIMKSSANASGFRSTGIKSEIAGKTGTTNDYKDAWFIGTRPKFSMAVWVGYDDQSYGMGNRGMGAVFAAPLWGKIGRKIEELNLMPKENFHFSKRASYHKICKESGDLAAETCQSATSEIFSSNGIPKKVCNLKHSKSVKKELLKSIF